LTSAVHARVLAHALPVQHFMRSPVTLPILGALAAGCGLQAHTNTIPLIAAAGIPLTVTPGSEIPLEVVTRSTAVRDPLPVQGSDVAYAEIEGALGHAVSSATVPWADAHRAQRPDGWKLLLEIVEARARFEDGRLLVTLNTRATLHTRLGDEYVAQTQATCREAGLTTPETGGPVIYACMRHLGRDLASWLSGVQP
jgi:hypothetical protein